MQLKTNNLKYLDYVLFLALISLGYAFLSHRPMLAEGSGWYYGILTNANVAIDHRFYRYIDYITQGPAVLLLKMDQMFLNYNTTKLAVYALSFFWTFHPAFSLFAVRKILKKKKRLDLFLFPVLSFATATISTLPYAVALVLPAMSIFWPLFFLILLRDKNSRLEFLFIFLLLIALVFSHEAVLIFFLLFIAMSVYDFFITKNHSPSFNRTIIAISILSIGWLAYVIFQVPKENSMPFLNALLVSPSSFRIFSTLIIFLFMSYLLLSFIAPTRKILSSTVIFILYAAVLIWFLRNLTHIMDCYFSRVTAIPTACIIALGAYFFSFKVKHESWLYQLQGKFAVFLVSLTLLVASAQDARLTYIWREGFLRLEEYVKNNPGCHNIGQTEYSQLYEQSYLTTYSLQSTSIIIQLLNDISPIRTLIFTDPKYLSTGRNACEHYKNYTFENNEGYSVISLNSHIKYSSELFKKTD